MNLRGQTVNATGELDRIRYDMASRAVTSALDRPAIVNYRIQY
jgi:hypothetical protein